MEAFIELLEAGDADGLWHKDLDDDDEDDDSICDNESESRGLGSCTFSPLEIILMMRANRSTVERVYNLCPSALTGKLLRNACRYGCQPGVLGFLVQQLQEPELLAEDDEIECGRLPIHMAMEPSSTQERQRTRVHSHAIAINDNGYRPTELDVLYLVKRQPLDCIREPDPWNDLEPWAMALRWNYTISILKYCFEKLAESITSSTSSDGYELILDQGIQHGKNDNPDIVRAITVRQVSAISIVFDSINSFETFGVCWTALALGKCLQLLLQKDNVTSLDIDIRLAEMETEMDVVEQEEEEEKQDGRDGITATATAATSKAKEEKVDTTLKLDKDRIQSIKDLATDCTVETLFLHFRYPQENPFFPWLLIDVALSLPRLTTLEIHIGRELRPVVPSLERTLRRCHHPVLSSNSTTTTQLRSLRILTSDRPKGELLPILDAIATNTTLKKFHYVVEQQEQRQQQEQGNIYLSSSQQQQNEGYRGYLAVCLMTSNTTLEDGFVGTRNQEEVHNNNLHHCDPSSSSHAANIIRYYTLLNRFGRKVARSRHTKLEELVELLNLTTKKGDWRNAGDTDNSNKKEEKLSRLDAHNIQFGLLREATTLWSGIFSSD